MSTIPDALAHVTIFPSAQAPLDPAGREDAPPVSQPFPLDVLPPALRRYVLQIAQTTHTPVDYAAYALLTIVSGLVGATYDMQIRPGWTEPAILYTVLIGAPGAGKSPVLKHLMAALYRREAQYDQDYTTDLDAFTGRLAAWEALKASEKPDTPKPHPPVRTQGYLSDFTMETVKKTLLANPRGVLIFQDELAAWLKSMGQYKHGGGNDRQIYLSLYGGTPLKVSRVGGGRPGETQDVTFVPHPRMSILGGIQPKVLRKVLGTADANDDGFWDRFLFVMPDDQAYRGPNLGDPDPTAWETSVGRLLTLPITLQDGQPAPSTLLLPEQTYDFWQLLTEQFQFSRTKQFTETLQGRYAKLPGILARLALVLHCVWWSTGENDPRSLSGEPITADDLVRAYHVLEHIARMDSAWQQHAGYSAKDDGPALAVREWMTKHALTMVSARDIQRQHLEGLRAVSDIHHAFTRAADLGWGEVKRRPRARVEFHLAVHAGLSGGITPYDDLLPF